MYSLLCVFFATSLFPPVNSLIFILHRILSISYLSCSAHVFENEHSRAVNKLSFHPKEPNILLSGSQDSTMKIFVRTTNLGITFIILLLIPHALTVTCMVPMSGGKCCITSNWAIKKHFHLHLQVIPKQYTASHSCWLICSLLTWSVLLVVICTVHVQYMYSKWYIIRTCIYIHVSLFDRIHGVRSLYKPSELQIVFVMWRYSLMIVLLIYIYVYI